MILEPHQWAKRYLIFSAISVLQQKKLKVSEVCVSWCEVPRIYLTYCFYFVSVMTMFDSACCILWYMY